MDEFKLNQPHTLFYLPMINRFIDNEWYVVHILHSLFDTWQLDQYKKNKKDEYIVAKDNVKWLVYYLNREEECGVLELISWNESYGIKMTRDCF